MVDGDTVFEPDTLASLVQPLADPGVGAVSGNTKVGNRSGLLGRWQHIEYVIGLQPRPPHVRGAAVHADGARRDRRVPARACWSRSAASPSDTLAEDTDLTLAIGRAGTGSSTPRTRARGPRRPRRSAGSGASATAGRSGRCRPSGSTRAPSLSRDPRRAPDRPARAAVHDPLPDPAAARRAADRPVRALRPRSSPTPRRVLAFWLGFNVLQLVIAVDRVPARRRVAAAPVGAAAAAVRLPPADVPRDHRVHGLRPGRRARRLEDHPAHRRRRAPPRRPAVSRG